MGGEALGSVKALCPTVGECQGRKVEMSGWVVEHPHRSRGRGMGYKVSRGENKKYFLTEDIEISNKNM